MNASNPTSRIVIAVTDSCSLSTLLRAAVDLAKESTAEVTAVYVHDDRWRRAASLPFTREVSRASGSAADFTVQRAEELTSEFTTRMHDQVNKLAIDTGLAFAFQALPESDQKGIIDLIGADPAILVVPTGITRQPIYRHLQRLKCRIVLIEENEE